MLNIRTRQFVYPDIERFTMNLASEVKEGMEDLSPLDPDTDARVVEDILGRIYGILIRLNDTDMPGLFLLFVDTDYVEVSGVLLEEHLFRMKDEENGKDI